MKPNDQTPSPLTGPNSTYPAVRWSRSLNFRVTGHKTVRMAHYDLIIPLLSPFNLSLHLHNIHEAAGVFMHKHGGMALTATAVI